MSPTDHPHRPAWFDISTPDAPVDTPVSRIAVFTDPDGNRVGLVSR